MKNNIIIVPTKVRLGVYSEINEINRIKGEEENEYEIIYYTSGYTIFSEKIFIGLLTGATLEGHYNSKTSMLDFEFNNGVVAYCDDYYEDVNPLFMDSVKFKASTREDFFEIPSSYTLECSNHAGVVIMIDFEGVEKNSNIRERVYAEFLENGIF